jgi:hypothetical protein
MPNRRSFALLVVAALGAGCRPSAPATPGVVVDVGPDRTPPSARRADSDLSPGGAGRGVVVCGDVTCAVGEASCVVPENGPPRCVSQSFERPTDLGGEGAVVLFCDDVSDCVGGEQCCLDYPWGGPGPLGAACMAEPCAVAVACTPGSRCPGDMVCVSDASALGAGRCRAAHPGVQCGASRCAGAAPVCCWDEARAAGWCAADAQGCDPEREAAYLCRNRADCGGSYVCCAEMAGGSSCSGVCPGPALGVLCDTDADCPPEGPGPGGARQRYDRCEGHACTGRLCHFGDWVPCDSE